MIRNVVRTDVREASDFLNLRLVLYVLVLGLIPAFVVARVRLPAFSIGRQSIQRGRFFAIGLLSWSCCRDAGHLRTTHRFFASTKRSEILLVPAATDLRRLRLSGCSTDFVTQRPGGGSRAALTRQDGRVTGAGKPLLLFLVIGETARAQNFQLGGYDRATTPGACANARACSISPMSLPAGRRPRYRCPACSRRSAAINSIFAQAARQTNLLDVLKSAGLSSRMAREQHRQPRASRSASRPSNTPRAGRAMCRRPRPEAKPDPRRIPTISARAAPASTKSCCRALPRS